MPIIAFKEKLKHGLGEENICIAFNCEYDLRGRLQLKDYHLSQFDSGDFKICIEAAIKKLNANIVKEYEEKNNGIYCLAILNYFVDEIPSIYSIKFESDSSTSIFYADELK
jgi:hypothetical protein